MRKAFFTAALVFALPCAAIAQIAVLEIKVLDGEGAVHPAGAHVSHPLTVVVTDETGRPVAGATVSFQLPAEGPGGIFPNGLRTDLALTDADGHATIHAVQLNQTAGQFRIRITAVKGQARAGAISFQSIADSRAVATATEHSPGGTPFAKEHSPGITPTTAKMRPHSSKKWLVLGALAAAGGGAFLGISHAGSKSAIPASVVSIGTPAITVGHP